MFLRFFSKKKQQQQQQQQQQKTKTKTKTKTKQTNVFDLHVQNISQFLLAC